MKVHLLRHVVLHAGETVAQGDYLTLTLLLLCLKVFCYHIHYSS